MGCCHLSHRDRPIVARASPRKNLAMSLATVLFIFYSQIIRNEFRSGDFKNEFREKLAEIISRRRYTGSDQKKQLEEKQLNKLKLNKWIETIKKWFDNENIAKNFRIYEGFSPNAEEEDIEKDILNAIFPSEEKTKVEDIPQEIELAIHWNSLEKVQGLLEEMCKLQKNKETTYNLMRIALLNNRADFVRAFMEFGFPIRGFLTIKRLNDLYSLKVAELKVFPNIYHQDRLIGFSHEVPCGSPGQHSIFNFLS